jgi:hypothetical protein
MKLFLVLIAFLLSINNNPLIHPKKCITINFNFVEIDQAGNLYFIKNDQLKKYNSKGELLKIYSNKKLGNIFSIDVSNPLRILLFYKDQNQIVYLDSQLSQTTEAIDLLKHNLEQTDLICNSVNNGFWLFDRQNTELCRVDVSFNKIINTGNLNVLLSKKIIPNYIIEKDNFIFLNNPDEGILVFDIYGTFYKLIPIVGLTHFHVNSNKITYFKENFLLKFDFLKLLSDQIAFKEQQLKDVLTYNSGIIKVYQDSVCFVN